MHTRSSPETHAPGVLLQQARSQTSTRHALTVTVHINAVCLVNPSGRTKLEVSQRRFFYFMSLHVAEHDRMGPVGFRAYRNPVATHMKIHAIIVTSTTHLQKWTK